MLDVADELGLMIQDETAIRGSNNRENFVTGRDNMVKHLADLVLRDRNHASVLRWSQSNEPRVAFFVNPGAGPEFDELLYQTVMALDSTRPISTDGDPEGPAARQLHRVLPLQGTGSSPSASTPRTSAPPGQAERPGRVHLEQRPHGAGHDVVRHGDPAHAGKGAEDTRPYTLLSTGPP